MNSKRRKNAIYIVLFISMIVVMLFLAVLNVCIGSVKISASEILSIITGKMTEGVNYNIVIKIRFPRMVAAAMLGGALALSGYLLQTFFHNPIAGPFVLGISSGAKLFVALVMVWCMSNAVIVSSFALIVAAFVGSIIATLFILLLSKVMRSMSMLIVGGIMVGYICTAITDFVVTFADDSNIVNLHNWSKGSFSGITWNNVIVIGVVIAASFLAVLMISKPISAYQMGEAYAVNMGVNVKVFRVVLIMLSSVLSATVTAFAGPVSFVGIAVPHLIRQIFKTSKPLVMIPASFLGGASFCLLCDLLARTMFAPTELSISTVTAIFGAPIVIIMLINRKRDVR